MNYKEIVRKLRQHDGALASEATAVIESLATDLNRAEAELRRLEKSREVNVALELEKLSDRIDMLVQSTTKAPRKKATKPATNNTEGNGG